MLDKHTVREVIRFPELSKKLGGVARSTIFRWERDRMFPKKVQLGPNCTGWLLDQVDAWILCRANSGGNDGI